MPLAKEDGSMEAVDAEVDWRGLILKIRRGRVIPILGPDLYTAADAAGAPSFDRAIALQLATALELSDVAPGSTLREVALRALRTTRSPPQVVRARIRDLIDAIEQPPSALQQLAQISGFRLFLTTGYDRLLQRALDAVRPTPSATFSYSLHGNRDDLPDLRSTEAPIVYHLLGSTADECAVTEADILEHMHGLISEERPEHLFDALRGSDLLFLGCGFPDWLARFFIRIMNDAPFSQAEEWRRQVVVDERVSTDAGLVLFLRHYNLEVLHGIGAAEFVARLHREWTATNPVPANAAQPIPAMVSDDAGVVFLSYCSEDRDVVRVIARELTAKKVKIFFDEQDIEPADEWDRVIRDNLARSALFIPFISRTTEVQGRRYFWSEWRLATEVEQREPPGSKFILPVALDDLDPTSAQVPPRFRDLQWYKLRDGKPTNEFIELVVKQYREQLARRRR